MEQRRKIPAPFIVLFLIGIGNLTHFSQNVRTVDAVGLAGGGLAMGVAVFGLVNAFLSRVKSAKGSPSERTGA
jgi:hypothetical protein